MKKLMMLGLCLMGVAGAQEKINCTTVSTPGFIGLSYDTVAAFPNPAKNTNRSFEYETFRVQVCGFDFSADKAAGTRFIDAPDMVALASLFKAPGNTKVTVPMYSLSGYRYPAIKQDFQYLHLDAVYDVNTRTLTAETNAVFSDKALAYKIDGGPLKPLWFEGKATPVTVPEGAKVIEVFGAQDDVAAKNRYVRIDLTAASVATKKDYPFPAK